MSYRMRTVIAVVLVEVALAGFWYWLMLPDLQGRTHFTTADAPREIGRTMGMVMGIVAGLFPVLYLIARKRDLSGR